MEEDEVVESGCIFLLLREGDFFGFRYFLKLLLPFGLEFFFAHETIVLDSNIECKGRTVPADPNFLIDFPQRPLELLFVKIGEIGGNKLYKDIAEFLQFFFVFLAVEFKGIVHDIAVVEGGNCDVALFGGFLLILEVGEVCLHIRYILIKDVIMIPFSYER